MTYHKAIKFNLLNQKAKIYIVPSEEIYELIGLPPCLQTEVFHVITKDTVHCSHRIILT